VDDGVCDCCDGTDEAGLAAKWRDVSCPNSCAEEGRLDAETRQAALTLHRDGLAKKAKLVEDIRDDKKTWKEELEVLLAELPRLQAAVATAKAAEANNGTCDDVRAEVAALNITVAGLRDEVHRLRARLATLEGTSGDVQGKSADGAAASEAVVSEYAKWMDGADSTLGKTEDPVEDPVEDAEDTHSSDGYLEEDDEDEDPGPIRDVSSRAGGTVAAASKSGPSSVVREAEKKVKDNKDAARKLQKKLEHLEAEEHLPFASLYGRCISRSDAEYTYKLCFFTEAKQEHVLLGRWSGWTGPKEAMFDNGATCYAGPARKLRVIFECGLEAEIMDIGEPSRCSYEAHVKHPGACTEEDIALLERPPVKHPKDEL